MSAWSSPILYAARRHRHGARLLLEELAAVRHLAAALGIERRLAQLGEECAVAQVLDRSELRQHVDLRVADEVGLEPRARRELGGPLQIALLPTGPRDLAVLLHEAAEAVDVDRLATLLCELLGQLDREAVRRGQRERALRVDRVAIRELVEHLHAAGERLRETLVLGANDALDLVGLLPKERVRIAHLLDDDRREPVKTVQADPVRLDDRPAQ